MEPNDASDYSKVGYWDARYGVEAHYEWFPSVYESCVDHISNILCTANASNGDDELRVLHLGCGNSALPVDVQQRCARNGVNLQQVAVDYSATVIQNMSLRHARYEDVQWVIGDVRHLSEVPKVVSAAPFDVIIDKGTMDALQADSQCSTTDEDLMSMLHGVSSLLRRDATSLFLQITWEIPYLRLHVTKRPEFPWGANITTTFLGDSDVYRLYVYRVGSGKRL